MAGKLPKKKVKEKIRFIELFGWNKSLFRNYMRKREISYGQAKRELLHDKA